MKQLITTILLLTLLTSKAQNSMKIIFKDGTEKTGIYKMRKPTFANSSSKMMIVSNKTKEKYTLDQLEKVIVQTDSVPIVYEVIDVKINFNDKATEKKLGMVAYKGIKMDLYYVEETIHQGGIGFMSSTSSSGEKYVKRSNDQIAYNMGYIYGVAARGIKKRVQDYFKDCPLLVSTVISDTIKKENTLDIVKFYEANCAN